jgi:hypothetical protein
MRLQELSALRERDSFCTTLFFEIFVQLGQVLVNGFSRFAHTYRKMKCARLSGAGFSKWSVVQQPASCKQPGACIRAVKKPDAAYYPEHREN